MKLDLSEGTDLWVTGRQVAEVRVAGRRVWPGPAPVISLDSEAATGGYAGSVYHSDRPGGVWQVDGVDLPSDTAQDWTMTLAAEGRAITYRVGAQVSNAIQMWVPSTLPDLAGVFDIRQGLALDASRVLDWTPTAGATVYSQPNAALRPLYQETGADGRPTVHLAIDRALAVAGLDKAPPARTFVGLLSPTATDTANWTAIMPDSGVGGWGLYKSFATPNTPTGVRTIGILTGGFANLQQSSALIVDGNTYLVAAKTARPVGTYGFRIDGAPAGSGTSSVAAFVDNGGTYTVAGFGGLSSHVISDAYLSVADIARIEGWVAWTLGDADRLADGHPYKAAAPRAIPAQWTIPDVVGSDGLWLRALDITGIADGAAIATDWPDASAGGHDAMPAGGPLYIASSINGLPAVRISSDGRKFTSPAILGPQSDIEFAIYGVVRRDTAGIRVWASHNNIEMYVGAEDSQGYFYGINQTPQQQTTPLSRRGVNFGVGAYLQCVRYDGTRLKMGLFGAAGYAVESEARTGVLGMSGALTIGDLSTGSYPWSGDIAEIVMVQSRVDDENDFRIIDDLCARYGLSPGLYTTRKKLVIFDGNSLTSGLGGTPYPDQALALLGADYVGINLGIVAWDTALRAGFAPVEIDSHYSPARAGNIAVLWEITNDLFFNEDPTAALSRYVAWCSGRRAAGFKVVAMTVLPRGDAYAGFETDRQTCNTYLRANWASFADAFADVAADPRIGAPGAHLDSTYFADGVHLTSAGYAIVASIVTAAITSLA